MARSKEPEGEPLVFFDWTFRPSSNVVICSRCLTVTYPTIPAGGSSLYHCCGQVWMLQGRLHQRLPGDFWDRFTWGHRVPKHCREPDDIADTGADIKEETA